VEESLVELLGSFGLLRPDRNGRWLVRVMSFSELALRRMRRIAPQVPRVQLVDVRPFWRLNGSLPYTPYAGGLSIELLRKRPEYVRRVQSRGYQVHVWTVDEPDDIDLCVQFGVQAIISNRPGEVIQRLREEHQLAAWGSG
jgi:glycerophosphoryl diester phosphodiesterase